MDYQEFLPAPPLRAYIRIYGYLKADPKKKQGQTVLDLFPPTLGKGLIILLPSSADILADNGVFQGITPNSYLTAHENSAYQFWNEGSFEMFSVIFHPGALPHFFRFPLHHLQDQLIAIEEINDPGLSNFRDQIKEARSHRKRVEIADQYFSKRAKWQDPLRSRSQEAIKRMLQSPHLSISAVAKQVYLGERQFRRTFTREIGTNPKSYRRNIRIAKALYLLKNVPEMDLWEISLHCGYYDPSHLIQDFKQVMYVTPTFFRQQAYPTSKAILYTHEDFLT